MRIIREPLVGAGVDIDFDGRENPRTSSSTNGLDGVGYGVAREGGFHLLLSSVHTHISICTHTSISITFRLALHVTHIHIQVRARAHTRVRI